LKVVPIFGGASAWPRKTRRHTGRERSNPDEEFASQKEKEEWSCQEDKEKPDKEIPRVSLLCEIAALFLDLQLDNRRWVHGFTL
jgi:hypothetical protein